MSVFFQKSIRLNSGGPLLLTSNILSSELTEVAIYRCSKLFKWWQNLTTYTFVEFEEIFRTSIFLTTSEGLLLNIPASLS